MIAGMLKNQLIESSSFQQVNEGMRSISLSSLILFHGIHYSPYEGQ